MRTWMLAAGAAALAVTAPALAERGGQGGGKDKSTQSERGGGKDKSARGERGGGKGQSVDRKENRDFAKSAERGRDRDRGELRVRGNDDDRRSAKAARFEEKGDRGRDKQDVRVRRGDRDDDDVRLVRGDRDRVRVFDRDDDFGDRWGGRGYARGFVDGCPPGLAKKNDECLPPGQYKKLVGTVIPAAFSSRSLFGPYRDWYRDDDRFIYRMGPDGLIYRVSRENNLIDALIPAYRDDFGFYPVGMTYPSSYNYYNVPMQYSSYWPDGDYNYRYGNGAIYQVDPRTSMIQSIVALLAGDLGVGQRLPLGYSAYNVPLDYRDRYYDTADNWYRYNDGYIYQVDPTTQLITAVIRALV